MSKLFVNECGQSLVQVLISIGIAGIMMASFSSMTANQQRESKALTEKLAASDLEKTAISALADGSVCKYVLNNPTSLTFDTTALPQTINVNRPIYASIVPGTPATPGPTIAQMNQIASGFSSSLVVNTIQLQVVGGSGTTYVANWLIGFDNTRTVRTVRPVSVSSTITVNTSAPNSPTAAVITGCQGNSGASFSNCVKREANTATKGACGFYSQAMCLAGETAVGGGLYGLSNNSAQNSDAIVNASGVPIGWSMTAYDVAQPPCSGNALTPDGTIHAGNPPCFPITGGASQMCGAAFAICCK